MSTLLLLALLQTPFDDTQDRFSIDLPEGWRFMPQPGDTLGAAFQRDLEGVVGNCFVKVLPVTDGIELGAYVARLAEGVENEPGYRLLANELEMLAGLPAVRRRYVLFINGDAKWPKMAEDRVAIAGRRAYVIHVETLAEAFGNFEEDFGRLFTSFRPKGAEAAGSKAKESNAALIGGWVMAVDASTAFELRKDGTFDLAGTPGVWRAEGSTLVLLPVGGGEERFSWRLRGGDLELSSPSLGEPMRYVRPGGGGLPIGKWASAAHSLQLSPSGTVSLDGTGGRYTFEDGGIVLKLGKEKRRVVLRYRMEGRTLYVSGGPFTQEHALEKKP